MWSVSLGLPNEKNYCIEYIEKKLLCQDFIKDISIARSGDCNRQELCLAGRKDLSAKVIKYVGDLICEIITSDFKYDFLAKYAHVNIKDPLYHTALMAALVAFDREYDKEYVQRELELNDVFMIDGFFSFRLTELRKRWKEICDLANSNVFYLTFADTFVELMRFLCGTIAPSIRHVRLAHNEGRYILTDDNGDKVYSMLSEYSDIYNEKDLIVSLIMLSPEIIELSGDSIPGVCGDFIRSVFNERIVYASV